MSDIPTPINSFVAEIRNGIAMAPKREAPPAAVMPPKPPLYQIAVKHPDSDDPVTAKGFDRAGLLDLADQLSRNDPKYAFVSLVALETLS